MLKPGAKWLLQRFGRDADRVRVAYRQALSKDSPAGRLVMADLAGLCGVATTSFVSGDPQATAFAEGRRAVFLHIADMLNLSAADLVALTVKENDVD